ncbi:MAG: hypothetical protein ACRD1Z_09385, partial [Vicinamibacteria bacterium]
MSNWNVRGIRTSLARSKKASVREPSPTGSVFRLGVAIPLISRFFAGMRIRAREKSIKTIGERIEGMVTKERGKVEDVINYARRTDLKSVFDRALSLRDKLEDAACTKLKFVDEDEVETGKPAHLKKELPLRYKCAKAIVAKVMGKDTLTGKTSGKKDEPSLRLTGQAAGLNSFLDLCEKQGGKVTVTKITAGAYG